MKFNNAQKKEIRLMHSKLTSRGLFDHLVTNFGLNCQYTSYRTALYEMGLYKCKMLRWTKEETQYLLENYKTKGNIDIAKKLSKRGRKFSKKQVEKKIKLLGIKRSPENIEAIKNDHVKRGVYREANLRKWSSRKAEEGEKRTVVANGTPRVMIKVNGTFIPYARHRYIELYGEIPPGYKVYFKDMDPLNISDENLEIRKGCGLNIKESLLFNKNKEKYLRSLSKPIVEETVLQLKEHKINPNTVKVWVNDKTAIYVKPGTDIQALKQKYNQLRI